MTDNDMAVIVEKVYKNFRLPHDKATTLKGLFTNIIHGKKGRTTETQHALKDISLNIKPGEFFGIVGRNGSGKSTLLKIIAGIYQPTRGTVKVTGKLVPFIELGVGFNPELTGRENVYLSGALMGFDKNQIDEKYDDVVEFAELEDFMDQKLKNYSSGMQVRLAFSLAIRAEADVLLVDEVLAVGDADFQRKCFDYFRNLKKNKKTVVFVTHDMDAVREYCDRAILIEKNQLSAEGSPAKIATLYSRMFTESPNPKADEKNSKRWGDKAITINKVFTQDKNLTDEDDCLSLSVSLESHIVSEEPIAGFAIKNAVGEGVVGTNTKIERISLGTLKSGKPHDVQWKIPNIFSDGIYVVDVAVLANDGITVHDWWESACSFKVYKDKTTLYQVQPPIEFKNKSKE